MAATASPLINRNHSPSIRVNRNKIRYHKKMRKKKKISLYKSIQALLLTKGIKVSLRTLRRISRKRLRKYIRQRFTQEEISTYLPLSLIYTTGITPTKTDITTTASNLPQSNQKKIIQLPKEAVEDINNPMPPTQEITTIAGNQLNTKIFSFKDDHPFDPGLWVTLPKFLPQNYQIPDPQFIATLQEAGKELSSYILQQDKTEEELYQIEPYYIDTKLPDMNPPNENKATQTATTSDADASQNSSVNSPENSENPSENSPENSVNPSGNSAEGSYENKKTES